MKIQRDAHCRALDREHQFNILVVVAITFVILSIITSVLYFSLQPKVGVTHCGQCGRLFPIQVQPLTEEEEAHE